MKLNFLVALLFITCEMASAAPPRATLVSVQKLWDKSPHCAFTDLVYWKGQFVCAFREGRSHMAADGRIRVLTSPDGETWTPAAELTLAGFDLRDAGLSITPENRLMLNGGAATRKKDKDHAPTGTFVAFSEDGKTWTEPVVVQEPGRWLWRVKWQDGKAYGISYAAGTQSDGKMATQLLTSEDGLKYTPLVANLASDGWPTEAAVRFAKDGTIYALQRRDGKPLYKSALLGVSRPPYKEWEWHDLGVFVGGPNFIQLPSGQWIAAGRFFDGGVAKTKLAALDVEAKTIEPILELPSGGDSSYPGLVWRDDLLWVSYYSSHEGKTNVYLAKVQIE
jgi:hypothetical protein